MLVLLAAVVTGAWADGIVCTASDLGKVLCTDGSIYENVSAATTAGKTAAAVIVYVDETNKKGLAIALADEGSMNWSTAKSTCEGKTAITGAKWCLPSQNQWEQMFQANGGNTTSSDGLITTITTAGGTTLLRENATYWSSSENSPGVNACTVVLIYDIVGWGNRSEDNVDVRVRACLAFAPPSYAVTLAEGTEDAKNWTIPAEAAAGTAVTATYSGERKVKSVKAVKKEMIKPDLLSGVFSVSSTKKVNFSKGNLQATYDGSSWTWAFANNQWDYIGNSAGNTKVTDASPFISENGTVDLFGWVGASSTWDGVNQYGITSSKARNATNGYGNSATENLKNDWGTLMGTGWHTLTKDEWAYMLNSRSGTSYCKAQVNSKSGLVIFPDGYTHPTGPTAPTNINTTNAAYTTNSWSGEDWTKMENAGCVFLPAAGSRDGNSVGGAGTNGTYWWSTHYEGGGDAVDRAYNLYFTNNYLLPTAGSYRDIGCSVRLVREVTE